MGVVSDGDGMVRNKERKKGLQAGGGSRLCGDSLVDLRITVILQLGDLVVVKIVTTILALRANGFVLDALHLRGAQ